MSNVESTAETILGFVTAALKVASSVVPVIPGAAAPLKAAEVLVETADGALHRVTEMGVEAVATRETEAGRAANKAAHLAGLREAIERLVRSNVGFAAPLDTAATRAQLTDAIMAEVAKRFP